MVYVELLRQATLVVALAGAAKDALSNADALRMAGETISAQAEKKADLALQKVIAALIKLSELSESTVNDCAARSAALPLLFSKCAKEFQRKHAQDQEDALKELRFSLSWAQRILSEARTTQARLSQLAGSRAKEIVTHLNAEQGMEFSSNAQLLKESAAKVLEFQSILIAEAERAQRESGQGVFGWIRGVVGMRPAKP